MRGQSFTCMRNNNVQQNVNRDLVHKPVQSVLQRESSRVILSKVACNRIPTRTSFQPNANFYNSCMIRMILTSTANVEVIIWNNKCVLKNNNHLEQ